MVFYMSSPTQQNLPAVLANNQVFLELSSRADNLQWLVPVIRTLIYDTSDVETLETLWDEATGTEGFADAVANWLLKSVGSIDSGLFIAEWPTHVKLQLALRFQSEVVAYKGTYRGILNTLQIFIDAGLLDTTLAAIDLADTAPNELALDVYTPSLHLAVSTVDQATDRNSLVFRTLQQIMDFHNLFGTGSVWVDYLDSGADFTLAGDRCS